MLKSLPLRDDDEMQRVHCRVAVAGTRKNWRASDIVIALSYGDVQLFGLAEVPLLLLENEVDDAWRLGAAGTISGYRTSPPEQKSPPQNRLRSRDPVTT
jgi:hypothetical protein